MIRTKVTYAQFNRLSTVVFPKLFAMFAERLFLTKELTFFFDLLENVLRERSQSKEVRFLCDCYNEQ
jgi:hypothetical protein